MKRAFGALLSAAVAAGAVAATSLGASSSAPAIAYETGSGHGLPLVKVANSGGGGGRVVGKDGIPSIAPDGSLVAVAGNPQGSAALVIASATSGKTVGKFFNSKQVSSGPVAWSPDSRYLAVGLGDLNDFKTIGKAGLAVIDTTTGTEKLVAHGEVSGVGWAPTGDTVVYGLATSPKYLAPVNLYSTNPTGTHTQQLTHDGHSADPVWGKRGIAFTQITRRGNDAPLFQLYLLRGSHRTQISHIHSSLLQDGLVPIAVSADGTKLIASFTGEDTDEAYAVNLLTHSVKLLMLNKQTVTPWGISRDGKRLLVDAGGFESPPSTGTIETMSFSGGGAKVLIRHGDYPSWNQ